MENVMNEKNAARYVGMSISFLRKARCEGTLAGRTPGPTYIKLGRAVRYSRTDLDAWIAEHRRADEAE